MMEREAEEIQHAPTTIPLNIGVSVMLSGIVSFATLITLLFFMSSDLQTTLDSGTLYPFLNEYVYAVGSTAGATGMVRLYPICLEP